MDASSHRLPNARIDLAPLAGVLLPMLLVCMLAAPGPSLRMGVPFPGGCTLGLEPEQPRLATLHIAAPGPRELAYAWNGQPVSLAQALQRVADWSRHGRGAEFNLKTDPAVPYQAFMRVFAAARGAGIERIGFNDLRAQPL